MKMSKRKPLKNEYCLIILVIWCNPGIPCPWSQRYTLRFISSCCVLHIHSLFGTYLPLTAQLITAIQGRQKT